MRRIKVALILFVFVTMNLVLPVFAEDEKESYILTLDQVKELALENNRSIKSMEAALEQADAGANIAHNAYRKVRYGSGYNAAVGLNQSVAKLAEKQAELAQIEAATGYDPDSEDDPPASWLKVKMEIGNLNSQLSALALPSQGYSISTSQARRNWEEAEKSYDYAQRAFEDLKKQLEFSIEKLYTGTINLQNQVNIFERKYQNLMKQLSIQRINLDLGRATNVEIDELAVQTSSLNNTINSLKSILKINYWQLNDMMGRDINSPLQLVGFEVHQVFPTEPDDLVINEALKNNASISEQKDDILIMKDDLEDLDGSNEKRAKRAEIKMTELAIEDTKINILNAVKSLLSDLTVKAKEYQLAKVSLRTAQTNNEWDKKKFELGMISQLQLETSNIALQEAINNKIAAGYDYLLAKHAVELAKQGVIITTSSPSMQ